jgi:serine protease Do
MTIRLTALLLLCCVVTLGPPAPARAQAVSDVFRQVSPSVVVIHVRGRDVAASGLVRFGEIGSGVLISADGRVMTAAHVVHSRRVGARVVASEPAADLSLLSSIACPRA